MRPVARFVLVVAALIPGLVAAQDTPAIQDLTDMPANHQEPIENGKPRSQGESRWTEVLEQDSSLFCEADVADCVRTQVRIRNDSQRPIHCHLEAKQWPGADGKPAPFEDEVVIFAGNIAPLGKTYAPRTRSAPRFSVRCQIYPASYEPLEVHPECGFRLLEVPNPDEFYPPAAKRRQEMGDVIIETAVKRGSDQLADVSVAGSSGSQDLDNAALQVAKGARASSKCPKQRYRFKVRFVIKDWNE